MSLSYNNIHKPSYPMKYLLTCITIILLSITDTKAQTVYNVVLDNAVRVVNSPTSGFTQVQIAQFKRTALVYLRRKAEGLVTDEAYVKLLDTQAYYLSEFITLFFDEILKSKRLSEQKRKEKILLFMDASVSNPLFDDNDEATTMSFITNGGELTPFCLNTDWQKAYAAAKSQL